MKLYFDLLISIGIVTTVLPAIILLYSSLRRKKSWEYKRKKTARLLVIVLLLGTITLLYGSFVESTLLITNRQTIDIVGIEKTITIAFVTDFQVGPYKKTKHIEHVVSRILSLKPDLVLIGGDHVDNADMDEDETKYLEPLKKLVDAGIPVYAIHGNHEYGVNKGKGIQNPNFRIGNVSARVKQYMENIGVLYLVNDLTIVTIHGQEIAIFGGDSYWADNLSFDSLEDIIDVPTIGLIHNPAAAWITAKEDIDLMLSGHTHGGQIRLPFIGPLGRVDDIIPAKWYQGLNNIDEDTQLFVTSGTGETGTRARLFNPPEVVLLTIE
jgi:uncharacterized protein